MTKAVKMQKITVLGYPSTFQFKTAQRFPEFTTPCEIRQAMLRKAMKQLKIESPVHDISDFVIETVEPSPNGEIWHLGS